MSIEPIKLACYCGTIRQAARAITALYDEHLAPHGIRITQFTILKMIQARKMPSTGDLAIALLMDSTTLSRTLATLKKVKLLDVRPSVDQRVRLWSLTEKGEALLNVCEKEWEKAQHKVFKIFGKKNAEELNQKIYDLSTKIATDGLALSA